MCIGLEIKMTMQLMLTKRSYEKMLNENVFPCIKYKATKKLWFQQDEATPTARRITSKYYTPHFRAV